MKNIFKYITLLCFVVSCSNIKNKQTIAVEVAKFKLPKVSLKIAPKDLDTLNVLENKIKKLKNIYKMNHIYLAMNEGENKKMEKDVLEGLKKAYDYQMKDFGLVESQQYKSKISKAGNNEYLYFYSFDDNIGSYMFKVINKNHDKIVGGTFIFENQSNYDEATKILNDFLKSVKFE